MKAKVLLEILQQFSPEQLESDLSVYVSDADRVKGFVALYPVSDIFVSGNGSVYDPYVDGILDDDNLVIVI